MARPQGVKDERDESGLTARERQVVAGVRAEKSQAAIARELGVSRQSVSGIVKRLQDRGVDLEPVRGQPPTCDECGRFVDAITGDHSCAFPDGRKDEE